MVRSSKAEQQAVNLPDVGSNPAVPAMEILFRKGRKMKAKLARRIASWERMPALSSKDAQGPNAKGTYYRKPGSNNK